MSIIIVSVVCLTFTLITAYSAFSTKLSITATGNIRVKTYTISELKSKYCNATSGDGLYVDTTEDGRCVYKGSNPNNYITFNGEEYRIIAFESDGTLKIIKSENLGNRAFEAPNTRTADYCNRNGYGCNVWGSSTTMLDGSGNNITAMPTAVGGTALALPEEDSQIAKYLNTDYYGTLSAEAKTQVDNHLWNVGLLAKNKGQILETDIVQEKAYKWRGNVGLINPSDYVKSSTDSSCINAYVSYSDAPCDNPICSNGNYLYNSESYWTLSPYSADGSRFVWRVRNDGCFEGNSASSGYGVRPSLYLKSNLKLFGEGTKTKPFQIES